MTAMSLIATRRGHGDFSKLLTCKYLFRRNDKRSGNVKNMLIAVAGQLCDTGFRR